MGFWLDLSWRGVLGKVVLMMWLYSSRRELKDYGSEGIGESWEKSRRLGRKVRDWVREKDERRWWAIWEEFERRYSSRTTYTFSLSSQYSISPFPSPPSPSVSFSPPSFSLIPLNSLSKASSSPIF